MDPQNTGLLATQGLTTNPDMTFAWNVSASSDCSVLNISVTVGPANSLEYAITADPIPWNNSAPVQINGTDPNSGISVNGTLFPYWNGSSYVVAFSGSMVYPNVNNVSSADQGESGSSQWIIVGAYLDDESSSQAKARK